ncbi:MAG TPA: hypothetical protein ENK04_01930 [Gammaproteobacteria bacterium]|nr:hypothetical protein [Gammaproteobacteria bacterium]
MTTASARAIPDGIDYHFAKESQTVDALINSLYASPSKLAVEHVKAINSHLKAGQVQAGQLMIVTPRTANNAAVSRQITKRVPLVRICRVARPLRVMLEKTR